MRNLLEKFVGYYLPFWLPVAFVTLPLLFSGVVQPTRYTHVADWFASVTLGLLSFWAWAVVTNAYHGKLVSSGGMQTGTIERRKSEFGLLFLFSIMTVGFLFCCYNDFLRNNWPGALFIGIVLLVTLAIYSLGIPND